MGLFHAYVVGQIDEFPQVHAFLDGNVVNPAGPGVLEVAVIDEVGTKAGGTAFKVDLIDKAMVYQSLQAVVNRRQGDAGEFFADPVVDFIGCALLLLIPGIIKHYSYAMTDYILKDEPELCNNAAIERSMAMMEGNKMKLFLLDLSFIGWAIL